MEKHASFVKFSFFILKAQCVFTFLFMLIPVNKIEWNQLPSKFTLLVNIQNVFHFISVKIQLFCLRHIDSWEKNNIADMLGIKS